MKVIDYVGKDAADREIVILDEPLSQLVAPPCVYDKRTRQITQGGPAQLEAGERWWAVGYEGNTTAFLSRAKSAHSAWLALGLGNHFSSLVVREVEEPSFPVKVEVNAGELGLLDDKDFWKEIEKQKRNRENGKSRFGIALDQLLHTFFKR